MPSLSSLGGLLRRVRVSRGASATAEVTGDHVPRVDDAADAAAVTTERIRRVVQGAKQQPAEVDATPAPAPPPAAPAATPASAAPGTAGETQILWGREFTLTERGLSKEQVVAFVEEILLKNKNLEEQSSPADMSRYVEKLMGELQTVEETVRAQATRDAEVEAAKITAEARRTAQEAITHARSEAAVQAQLQADAILTEARKKAEIADGQVRIQAQLMLGKARDQVQEHIRKEGELAFSRIMASLTTMVQESQQVESEWKQQTARLWLGAEAALSTSANLSAFPIVRETLDAARRPAPPTPAPQEPVEASPSGSPSETAPDETVVAEAAVSREPSETRPATFQQVEIQPGFAEAPSVEAVVDTEIRAGVAPEPVDETFTPTEGAPSRDEEVPLESEPSVPSVSAEVVEPELELDSTPSVAEEATPSEVSEEPATWTAAPVVAEEEAVTVESTDATEPLVWTAAPAEAEAELAEAVTVLDEEEAVDPAEEDAPSPATDSADPPAEEEVEVEVDETAKRAFYAGEIELSLAPPVDPALLARLYSRLLAMSDLRILRTMGSWDSGTTINLLLERPQPLIGRLLEIPEVRIAPEQVKGPRMGSGGDPGDRIAIALRE